MEEEEGEGEGEEAAAAAAAPERSGEGGATAATTAAVPAAFLATTPETRSAPKQECSETTSLAPNAPEALAAA